MSKAAKRRYCPAAKVEITPAECGEKRGSTYLCPADCEFTPFASANYSKLLELEDSVDKEFLDWVKRDPLARDLLQRELVSGDFSRRDDLSYAVCRALFFLKDADGLTVAQQWERAGFPGLNNDQRVFFRGRISIHLALIEVHRVLDSERVEVVDLLAPEDGPFIITDRTMAESAVRFDVSVSMVYGLPHYHRVFGDGIGLPSIIAMEPREVLEAVVRHLGGSTEVIVMREWLAQNYFQFTAALNAVFIERKRRAIAKLDAKVGKATYELRGRFAECRNRLDEALEVEMDDLGEQAEEEGFADAREWHAAQPEGLPESSVIAGGSRVVLGRILLGQAQWRVEATGSANFAELRKAFERQMGSLVKFTGETFTDLAKSTADKLPSVDVSLVPPRLLEDLEEFEFFTSRVAASAEGKSQQAIVREFLEERDRSFLDTPLPTLGNKTPREASRDAALRPRLIMLMKERVRATDERNRDTGSNTDVNWMLRELGLDEINFEPPPSGRPPRLPLDASDEGADDSFEDFDDDSDVLEMDDSLPPAPPLPPRPFTVEEVEERVQALSMLASKKGGPLGQIEADGCTLFEDVGDIAAAELNGEGMAILMTMLAAAWGVFVPPGTRGPNISRARLAAVIAEELEKIERANREGEAGFLRYLQSGTQANVDLVITSMLDEIVKDMPKVRRISADDMGIIGTCVRAVVDELDRVHRQLGAS